MRRIDYWHVKFPYLGSRKITVKLREDGYKVGRKTVRRLMQLMSIYVIYSKVNLSKRNFKESIVPLSPQKLRCKLSQPGLVYRYYLYSHAHEAHVFNRYY